MVAQLTVYGGFDRREMIWSARRLDRIRGYRPRSFYTPRFLLGAAEAGFFPGNIASADAGRARPQALAAAAVSGLVVVTARARRPAVHDVVDPVWES